MPFPEVFRMALRTKLAALLTALILALSAGVSSGAESAPGSAAVFAQLSRLPIAAAPAKVSVLLCGAEGNGGQPDIRYDPQSAEEGLYAGPYAQAGTLPAQLTATEDGSVYTVTLTEPGRYLLNGEPFYVVAGSDESMAALQDELAEAAEKAEGKKQKQTAEKLYNWLVKRVRNVPAEEADGKMEQYGTDPVNCLLMGAALPETYADLYHLVLRYAGIESVIVSGTAGDAPHRWVLCRLDGEWFHADPALDDIKDKSGKKYFALDSGKIARDHALSEDSAAFIRNMVEPLLLDAFMDGNKALQSRLELKSTKEGWFFEEYEFVGKNYSLGPGEPVTVRRFRNFRDNSNDEGQPDWIIAANMVSAYYPWDETNQTFLNFYTSPEIPSEEDINVLSISEDRTSVTVSFNKPGLYMAGNYCYYVLDPEDPRQVEVARKLDEALASCRGETDRETAWNLYRWEASQLTYDYAVYKRILKHEDDETDCYAQDPVASLIRGQSVCGGYSNLYTMLLNSAGIPARQLVGKRNVLEYIYHAWNMARLDGEWVYFDLTWDDYGKSASNAYFAVSYEKISKDHIPVESDAFLKATVLTGIYDELLSCFYRDWKPKESLPAFLRMLPADAKGYGFPSVMPKFFNQKLTLTETGFEVNPGRTIMSSGALVMNKWGAKDYDNSFGTSVWKDFPYSAWIPGIRDKIVRFTLADYDMNRPLPVNKPFIDQSVEMAKGVVEYEEYNYHVPLKKNEIRGYNEHSYRTWTWDADKKPLAAGWTLVNDTETLTVTAFFDGDGKTRGWQITRVPLAGNELSWAMDRDGRITLLRCEQDGKIRTLADRTDVCLQNRYSVLWEIAADHYPELADDPSLTENGVRVYGLSSNDQRLYGPDNVFASRDDLFVLSPDGRPEINPDARDLNGDPLKLEPLQPVLDAFEMISIAAE